MKRLLFFFLCFPSLAFAACPTTSLTFKDAAGATQTLCFGGASGSFLPQYQPVDSANAAMFPAVAALADATTNPTTAVLGSLNFGFNGTTWDRLQVDASKFLKVTIAAASATNISMNEAQINGVTPLMGNGTSGTGSQRVNVASDNSAIANWGQGATGSAVPTGAVQMAGVGSGNLTAPIVCDNYTPFSFSSTSAQKIITKVAAKKVYICSINITAPNTNVALIEGTQTTNQCDTSTAGMAGGTTAATGWNFANATAPGVGLTLGSGMGVVIKTANANFDVCLLASAANQVSGGISWTQQ